MKAHVIADTRRDYDALLKSDAHYRLLVENIIEYALITLDTAGRIKSWNRGAERLLKYKRQEVLDKYADIFFTEEDKEKGEDKREMMRARKYGRSEDERWHVRKGGSRFWGSGVMLRMEQRGKMIGFVKIFRDTTKKMEKERRKDDFVGIASHELRTPLSILKSSLEIVLTESRMKNDTTHILLLQKMNEQVDRLAILINDLLDLSKITTGQLLPKRQEVDIPTIAKEVMRNAQGIAKEHKLTLLGDKSARTFADKGQIVQVLHNLLNNAVKYSPDGKRIDITVRNRLDHVEVSVRDYGIGIPEAEQKKIFQRFYRVRNRQEIAAGLGIGLYVCSEIIRAHSGTIGVKSEKGKGSTFYFTLPKLGISAARSK